MQAAPDQETLAALGKAYDALGELTQKIGDQAAALAVYRKALAVRRTLAYEPDADDAKKLDLARSLIATGWLERATGDKEAARTSGEEARELAKEVGTQNGDADPAQDVLIGSYRLIALVLSETGDREGALEAYRHLLTIRQKAADATARRRARPDRISPPPRPTGEYPGSIRKAARGHRLLRSWRRGLDQGRRHPPDCRRLPAEPGQLADQHGDGVCSGSEARRGTGKISAGGDASANHY